MHIITRKEERKRKDLDRFLAIPPDLPDADSIARERLAEKHYPRQELANILKEYNQAIGNDGQAIANAEKLLEEQSCCIVTGQQLGLLGGPAYTLLKAVTCILLAREKGAVPIFWLATEDHDIGEIQKTITIDTLGNIKKYRLSFPKGLAVEDLVLSKSNIADIQSFFTDNNAVRFPFALHEGDSYASVMARFLAHYFKGTGLLFIEPKYLRPLAAPFFSREIKDANAINHILLRDQEELEKAGQKAPLEIHPGEVNLFYKDDSAQRIRVARIEKGFSLGEKVLSESQIDALIHSGPERFSASAAARPLMQCSIIPTLAYVAGPTELQYHRQLKGYFAYHAIPMPWIVPRLSATFVPMKAQNYLQRLSLEAWQPIPTQWEALYPELAGITHAKERKKMLKEEVDKLHIPLSALHYLKNVLRPYGERQERTLNWLWVQSQTEEKLVGQLLNVLSWNAAGHHYCYLS